MFAAQPDECGSFPRERLCTDLGSLSPQSPRVVERKLTLHDSETRRDYQVTIRKEKLLGQNMKAKESAYLLLSFNINSHTPYNFSNRPPLNIFPPSSTIVSPLTCPLALLLR